MTAPRFEHGVRCYISPVPGGRVIHLHICTTGPLEARTCALVTSAALLGRRHVHERPRA